LVVEHWQLLRKAEKSHQLAFSTMLFNSNFSFTSSSRRQERVNSRNIQHNGGGIGVNHELGLSPHSTMDALHASWGRRRGSSSIKQQDDRLSVISTSASSAMSRDSDSTMFSSRRSSISVNEVTEKMKFSVRRRQSNNLHASNQVPENIGCPVIASALTMDIASLRRQQSKPRKISVPARSSSLSRTSRTPTSPKPEKVTRRPPALELEPPCPRSSESLHEVDHSLISPFQARPPNADTHVGIQMLLNTLDGDSDSEEEDELEMDEQNCQTVVNPPNPVPTSTARPLRMEIPMPPIDESGETSSDCSSDSDNSNRRHSTVSTIPTSVSGSSTPSLSISKNRCSVASARSYQDLGLGITGLVHEDQVGTNAHSLSEITSPSSRRSSGATAATFFCRGNRNSFLSSSNRFSIGLGSIAGSDIDLEAGLEDSTHFPGINELKKQISWLSLRGSQIYDSDDDADDDYDDDGDIEDYHQYMASMVPRKYSVSSSSTISRKSLPTTATSLTPKPRVAPHLSPSGPVLQAPTRRRARRRTASSECIVLEVLQEIRASIELLQPPSMPSVQFSKGLDFWDDSISEDTEARDQILRSSVLSSRI